MWNSFVGWLKSDPSGSRRLRDDYDLHNVVLGTGSSGTVFRATRRSDGTEFAAKKISTVGMNLNDRAYLHREVQILKELDHPHILRLIDVVEESDATYLVTELIRGGELFDRIVNKSRYTEREARGLVTILLETLKHLHANGVVHRDLKPENLLMRYEEGDDTDFVIADFGLAKSTHQKTSRRDFDARSPASDHLQHEASLEDACGTLCGTPGYIAPESLPLLLKREARRRLQAASMATATGVNTPSSSSSSSSSSTAGATTTTIASKGDIWSAGVIVYIILAGSPPFSQDDVTRNGERKPNGATDVELTINDFDFDFTVEQVSQFRRTIQGSLKFDPDRWSEISPEAKDLVKCMLAVLPSERWSAEELLKHPWITRRYTQRRSRKSTGPTKTAGKKRSRKLGKDRVGKKRRSTVIAYAKDPEGAKFDSRTLGKTSTSKSSSSSDFEVNQCDEDDDEDDGYNSDLDLDLIRDDTDLSSALIRLREWNAKRRFRRGILSVLALRRFSSSRSSSLTGSESNGGTLAEEDEKEPTHENKAAPSLAVDHDSNPCAETRRWAIPGFISSIFLGGKGTAP